MLQRREEIDLFHLPPAHLVLVAPPRAIAQSFEHSYLPAFVHHSGRRLLDSALARFPRLTRQPHDPVLMGDPIPVPLDGIAVETGDKCFMKLGFSPLAADHGMGGRPIRVGKLFLRAPEFGAQVLELFAAKVEQRGCPKAEGHGVVSVAAAANCASESA